MYANWKLEPPRIRVGINGYGTIARNFLRCAIESNRGVDVVAINAPGVTPELLIYMIKYNSVCTPFPGVIKKTPSLEKPLDPNAPNCLMLEVCGRSIAYYDYKNPEEIPWQWMGVEYVLEASEQLTKLEDAEKHLRGGRARKVVVVGDTVDIPIVFYPISCQKYQRGCSVISTGSADALAFATLLYLLQKEFGIIEGMTTILTGFYYGQNLVDGSSCKGWRLGRSAGQSIIPYNLDRVLHTVIQSMPEMAEKIKLIGMSVPVDSGCVIDLTCRLSRPVASPTELAAILQKSTTLKTLGLVHAKCQPGWLLSQWCPEITEPRKSELPRVEAIGSSTFAYNPNSQITLDPSSRINDCSMVKQSTVANKIESNPFLQDSANFITHVVKFWQNEEDQCVGRDVLSSECMVTFDAHSCLAIPDGSLIKLVAWYDREMAFCKRILDLLVYMRYIDYG